MKRTSSMLTLFLLILQTQPGSSSSAHESISLTIGIVSDSPRAPCCFVPAPRATSLGYGKKGTFFRPKSIDTREPNVFGNRSAKPSSPAARHTNPVLCHSSVRSSKIDLDHAELGEQDGCSWYRSHISLMRSFNLAGMVSDGDDGRDITIHLGNGPNLVAITGETGGGKSLLIAKVADLVTGGKATATLVGGAGPYAEVEVVMKLSEPHLSFVEGMLEKLDLDPSLLHKPVHAEASSDSITPPDDVAAFGTLVLKRILSLQQTSGSGKPRLKSTCEINDEPVTLKALRAVAEPLLTIVDASAASSALSRPNARMAVVDMGVPVGTKSNAHAAKIEYRKCRERRESLEREIESRALPPGFMGTRNQGSEMSDEDLELLKHWVDELDSFEERMNRFRDNLAMSFAGGEPDEHNSSDRDDTKFPAVQAFVTSSWFDISSLDVSVSADAVATSSFYSNLIELRESVKSLDSQVDSARAACDALSLLSSHESAVMAVERARKCLFESADNISSDGNESGRSYVSEAAETSHELLNAVEEALASCVRSIEEDTNGLIPTLERTRCRINLSLEEIDAVIGDWNTLARKHSISPYALPSCHHALRCELDGNVEARSLLPRALEAEKAALDKFETVCAVLTAARISVVKKLSSSVTQRLPELGMGDSAFQARLNCNVRQCTDVSAYGNGSLLGVDSVDFLLVHQCNRGAWVNENDREVAGSTMLEPSLDSEVKHPGGKIDIVASSGEKARVLLAIETELPGSVGACCGLSSNTAMPDQQMDDFEENSPSSRSAQLVSISLVKALPTSPVAVIYDEIDAHVGGRAAVALAKLLADQTRQDPNTGTNSIGRGRGQVISITHSPSVAAIADQHIVIKRLNGNPLKEDDELRTAACVSVSAVVGTSRIRELARMASGDLASHEAEIFADALIRDGMLHRAGVNS